MVLKIYGAGIGLILLLIAGILVAYGVVGLPTTRATERIVPVPLISDVAPDDTVNIVFLGTSLTSRGRWHEDLRKRLSGCRPGQIATDRVALSGGSSRWGLRVIRDYLVAHEDDPPDILVVEFSISDASIAKGFPLWFSGHNHREIVRLAWDHGVTVFLATMNPALGRQAWERPGQARYQALYRDIAAQENVGLIDTIADWTALTEAQQKLAIPDGLHPTNDAMASIILPPVEKALRPLICSK